MKFNLKYFILSVLIFIVEVLIATVFKDVVFLRSYFGDVLVVILIYTFILAFFEIKNKQRLIFGVFAFAVLIEILQYFKISDLLHFENGSVSQIVVGNSFSWIDVSCYAIGCAMIWFSEFKLKKELTIG